MPFSYHNVDIKFILNKEEFASLKTLYDESPVMYAHQDYNLFNVEKRIVKSEDHKNNIAINRLDKYGNQFGLIPHSHYFLKYPEWSFTKCHIDNKKLVQKTIITFVDVSKDLVGGDSLFYEPYWDLPQEPNTYVKRKKNSKAYNAVDIIPVIAPNKIGSSLIYDATTTHGVTQVRRGHRTVLVSWFKHQ